MTEEEQLLAYADYCGISVDELMSYLDCYESRRLVGLAERDMTPQQQIGLITGRVCSGCGRLRESRWFPLEGAGLHAHCVDCCCC